MLVRRKVDKEFTAENIKYGSMMPLFKILSNFSFICIECTVKIINLLSVSATNTLFNTFITESTK